ncbi:MAG: hypothetical protein PHG40_05790 [Candidatus Omnitrophica bacterium]|nr:hypothetical protein [Candidatus Omnitrophota bacterium]
MRRTVILLMLVFTLCGCASVRSKIPFIPGGLRFVSALLPPYDGLRAKIIVPDFEIKTSRVTKEIGADFRKIMIAALSDSDRFLIVAHQEPAVAKEAIEITPKPADKTKDLQAQEPKNNADLVINVVVSDFEPQAAGGSGGIGGGGGSNRGIFGGLLGASLTKPHLDLDIRISDAVTLGPVASTRVMGQSTDAQKAIQICIVEATRFISRSIPGGYYKYREHGKKKT